MAVDCDPGIRWQTMRDLTGASAAATAAERARIPREGLGAEILARQESDGSWRRADAPVWLPTPFPLLLLRATGVDRADPVGGRWKLRSAAFGAAPFFAGEVEPCINGGVLALGAYFGRRRSTSRAGASANSLTTAVGIAKRRRACARRSTPPSAF